MISGAEMMVKCLQEEKVTITFGYPGAVICPFYDYLIKTEIAHVLVRSEQNGAHEASGFARASGKAGVCIATSGPGATNLITGLATAYMDSIPIVAITGQVNSELLGRDVFQEADITGACESFTKHSYLVKNVEDIPRVFKEAFHIATTGRPGPVLIDVPFDTQLAQAKEFIYPEKAEIIGYKPRTKGHSMQIKKAAKLLESAKRPVICCGGGVVSAGARDEIIAFAKKTGIPVVTTMMGLGVIPMDNDHYFGMIGSHGKSYANRMMNLADVIVLCGARVGDRTIPSPNSIKASIIHIDIDPAEIGKNIAAQIPIVGDIKSILQEFTETIKPCSCDEWLTKMQTDRNATPLRGEPRTDFVEPRVFMRDLSDMMEDDAILTADVGQNQIWAANHFNTKDGRFLTSGGMGTMGYALPSAIGAKLAKPKRQVVAVCGDGSFQMSMCELAVVNQTGIALKLIVMRNKYLGMVKELQDKMYQGRYVATPLDGDPDIVKVVQAYGIKAAFAQNNQEANRLAKEMLESKEAYVLVCDVDPDTPSI